MNWKNHRKMTVLTKFGVLNTVATAFCLQYLLRHVLSVVIAVRLTTINYIWAIQPSLRSFVIEIQPLAKMWGLCVRSFCNPLYESLGPVLSKIKLTLKRD